MFEQETVTMIDERHCLWCRGIIPVGETAYLGMTPTHGYSGYRHIACYDAEMARQGHLQEHLRLACQGPIVSIWFGPDTDLEVNGSGPDGTTRTLPVGLPAIAERCVVEDMLRRPLAQSNIRFPDLSTAETWWTAAISAALDSVEMYWFDGPGHTPASREYRGHRFGDVESTASFAELSAGAIAR